MITLQGFSQGRAFLEFVDRIHGEFRDNDDPLFLHGFVVSRPPLWVQLRRGRRQGGGYSLMQDTEVFAPIGGMRREEYYTADGEDEALREAWHRLALKRAPFLVRVCVAPTTPATVALRRRFEDACGSEARFAAIVEDRAPAGLAASLEGGRHMTAGPHPGTIGGFLEDPGGKRFGLTCGHVGQFKSNAAFAQDVGGTTVHFGTVVDTNWPLKPSTSLCQPSTAPNRVDLALTDVASGHVATNQVRGIGSINGIMSLNQLGSGHRVQMAGAVSGKNDYDITGYVVTYRTHHNGTYYCFTNVYEISGVISNSLLGTYVPIPKLGNSGSWVCCPAHPTGTALCGMLFAVDHARGFVCFADEMESWWTGQGYTLRPF